MLANTAGNNKVQIAVIVQIHHLKAIKFLNIVWIFANIVKIVWTSVPFYNSVARKFILILSYVSSSISSRPKHSATDNPQIALLAAYSLFFQKRSV